MFQLTGLPDILPQFFDLVLPAPKFDEQMMPRLWLVAIAPPTLALGAAETGSGGEEEEGGPGPPRL